MAAEESLAALQSLSAIQAKIPEIVWRVQREINLDQLTLNGFTYRQLQGVDLVYCCNNPHLYQSSEIPDEQVIPTFPQELQEDEGKGWGRGGNNYHTDWQPPPYTGRAPTRNNLINCQDLAERITERITAARMAARLDTGTPLNTNTRGVGSVVGVKNNGGIPGRGTPTQPITQNRLVEEHSRELYQGVVDTRTQLLDSFFILIFILTLLHFLTYIWFLCTL